MKEGTRIEELAANGVGNLKLIACVLEGDIDFRRARDRKDFHDRVSGAVFYSDFLSEKVRRTKARRKVDGAYTGGGPAFGYKFTPDGLVIDPHQAALIHEAVKRLADHVSLYRITMDWQAAGLTTAGGARWRPATLRRMLTGEHLTGGNGYPAILDDIEAAIVRQELGDQPQLKQGRPRGRRSPLVGLLRCAECGQKLTTGQGRYRCGVSHGGCGAVTINAYPLERYIALEGLRRHIENLRSGKKHGRTSEPVAVADTSPIFDELHEVERRIEEIVDGLDDGTLTVAVAGRASKKLEERRRALTERLARSLPPAESGLKVELADIFTASDVMAVGGWLRAKDFTVDGTFGEDEGFRERWESRTLSEAEVGLLRDLFIDSLDQATISRRESRGRKFDPTRVEIRWR
jgi:recombinase